MKLVVRGFFLLSLEAAVSPICEASYGKGKDGGVKKGRREEGENKEGKRKARREGKGNRGHAKSSHDKGLRPELSWPQAPVACGHSAGLLCDCCQLCGVVPFPSSLSPFDS